MKYVLFMVLGLAGVHASAQNCFGTGNLMTCSDGTTGIVSGDTVFMNNGTIGFVTGNTVMYSDGSVGFYQPPYVPAPVVSPTPDYGYHPQPVPDYNYAPSYPDNSDYTPAPAPSYDGPHNNYGQQTSPYAGYLQGEKVDMNNGLDCYKYKGSIICQ